MVGDEGWRVTKGGGCPMGGGRTLSGVRRRTRRNTRGLGKRDRESTPPPPPPPPVATHTIYGAIRARTPDAARRGTTARPRPRDHDTATPRDGRFRFGGFSSVGKIILYYYINNINSSVDALQAETSSRRRFFNFFFLNK